MVLLGGSGLWDCQEVPVKMCAEAPSSGTLDSGLRIHFKLTTWLLALVKWTSQRKEGVRSI